MTATLCLSSLKPTPHAPDSMSIILSQPSTIAIAPVQPHFRELAVHFHRARSQIVWQDFPKQLTTQANTLFGEVPTLPDYFPESGTPLLYSRRNTAVGSLKYPPSKSFHSLGPALMFEKGEQVGRFAEGRLCRGRDAGGGPGDGSCWSGQIGGRDTGRNRAEDESMS
jgi:hypothetical protein